MAGSPVGQADAAAAGQEHRATIADLQRRNEELSAAVAARDAFLAIAAHELRNPMTPVVGHLQRLRRQCENGGCSLDDVTKGLRRIEGLLELYLKRATTLLDVSRITSGKLRLEPTRINVAELAQRILQALAPAAQHAGSIMTLVAAPDLEATADHLALEQILDNLLLNALKYGAGRPIEVTAHREGAALTIRVKDRGIGMSPQDQARIFEPFERAISYESHAGFGIGLWVVRRLVDAMGGEISVDSVLHHGTTFTVRLPQDIQSPP